MSAWPRSQSRWIDNILFHDEMILEEALKKTFKFYLVQEHRSSQMTLVRRKDCPTKDNICQALEAIFGGNIPCRFGSINHQRKDFILWKVYSELYHWSPSNAPFLYKTSSKIHHHSWMHWLTCSCCLRNNCLSLENLQILRMQCPIIQTIPHLPHAPINKLDLWYQWWSFS